MKLTREILIILVLALLVVIGGIYLFSLIQPNHIEGINEYPLFRDTLYVVLAIAAVFIGVLGGGTYYILSGRIREDARRAAENEYLVAIVTLFTHSSSLYGRMFENLRQLSTHSIPYLIPLLDRAVQWGKEADACADRLGNELQGEIIMGAKNNYIMALALKQDKKVAKEGGIEQIIHYPFFLLIDKPIGR